MKVYKVYAKPEDGLAARAIFVAQCFSWGAFFFGFFWVLFKHLWIVAIISLGVVMVLLQLPGAWSWGGGLILNLILASFAPELQAWSLRRQGLAECGMSVGTNQDEAEVRFYTQAHEGATVVVSPVSVGAAPVLGDDQLSGGLV